jgi:hypothetical protein
MKPHACLRVVTAIFFSTALAACPPPAPQNSRGSSGSTGGGRVERDPVAVTMPRRAGAVSGSVTAPEGVTAVTQACAADRAETCNGLDDNCDGVIDNNCGYLGGGIQVTTSWRGAADIDLRITDPSGEEVYFGHRQSATGAQMDMDANGECTATRPTAENIRWASQTPPTGRYEIKLTAFDLCGAADAAATLSISVGGRVVGAWTANFTYARQEFVFPLTVQ